MNEKWKILFVDDEENVLNSLKRLLRNEGYEIHAFSNPLEALEFLKKERVHLIVSDQRMPNMNGAELLEKIKKNYPEIIRTILSGYSDAEVILKGINSGQIFHFFTKPWEEEELKIGIRQCLKQYELEQEIQNIISEMKQKNRVIMKIEPQLQNLLKDQNKQLNIYQTVFSELPLAVVGVDSQGLVTFINKEFISFSRRYSIFKGPIILGLPFPTDISKISEVFYHKKLTVFKIDVGSAVVKMEFIPLTQRQNLNGDIMIFTEEKEEYA